MFSTSRIHLIRSVICVREETCIFVFCVFYLGKPSFLFCLFCTCRNLHICLVMFSSCRYLLYFFYIFYVQVSDLEHMTREMQSEVNDRNTEAMIEKVLRFVREETCIFVFCVFYLGKPSFLFCLFCTCRNLHICLVMFSSCRYLLYFFYIFYVQVSDLEHMTTQFFFLRFIHFDCCFPVDSLGLILGCIYVYKPPIFVLVFPTFRILDFNFRCFNNGETATQLYVFSFWVVYTYINHPFSLWVFSTCRILDFHCGCF